MSLFSFIDYHIVQLGDAILFYLFVLGAIGCCLCLFCFGCLFVGLSFAVMVALDLFPKLWEVLGGKGVVVGEQTTSPSKMVAGSDVSSHPSNSVGENIEKQVNGKENNTLQNVAKTTKHMLKLLLGY